MSTPQLLFRVVGAIVILGTVVALGILLVRGALNAVTGAVFGLFGIGGGLAIAILPNATKIQITVPGGSIQTLQTISHQLDAQIRTQTKMLEALGVSKEAVAERRLRPERRFKAAPSPRGAQSPAAPPSTP